MGVIMNCLLNTLTYILLLHYSGILKLIDLNVVWEGNVEAISDFFCGLGYVIPKHA